MLARDVQRLEWDAERTCGSLGLLIFFCENCLACSHSLQDRNLHSLNNEVTDYEFFRAQAPYDVRSECPPSLSTSEKVL